MSTFMKPGLPWLYDETTGDIVGVKDADGGDSFFTRTQTDADGSTSLLGPSGIPLSVVGLGSPYIISVSSVAEIVEAIADITPITTRSSATSVVTATAGSAVVTGLDTSGVYVGDLWKRDAGTRYYKVKQVDSASQITLWEPILGGDAIAGVSTAYTFYWLNRYNLVMAPNEYTVVGTSPIVLKSGIDFTALDAYATSFNEGQIDPNSPFSNLGDNNFTNIRWAPSSTFGAMDGMFGANGYSAIDPTLWAGARASFNRCIVDSANAANVHSGGQLRMPILNGGRVDYNQCEFLLDGAASFLDGGAVTPTNTNTRIVMNGCKHIKTAGATSAAGDAVHQFCLEVGGWTDQTLKGTFDIVDPVIRFQDLDVSAGSGYSNLVGGILVNAAAVVNLHGGSITVENTSAGGDASVGVHVVIDGAEVNVFGTDISVAGTTPVGVKVDAVAATVNVRTGTRISASTNTINAEAGSTVKISPNTDLIGGATTGLGTISHPPRAGILRMGAVPSGIAPSGSVGANGALTLDTALPVTYSDGIWLYLPAGAAYAGSSAGMYWVVMSSGTAGTIYDTIGTGFLNNQIGAAVPISAAGPGIYAGTTAEITLTTFSLPGNLMGPNGYQLVRARGAHPNNANNKSYRRSIAGVSTGLANFTTTNTAPLLWELINRGKATSNLFGAPQNAFTANTALNIPSAIDTTVDNDVTLTGQLAVATDFLIYDMVVAEVISTGAQS